MNHCIQCGTDALPRNEDFCSDECAWLYAEEEQMQRQEGQS